MSIANIFRAKMPYKSRKYVFDTKHEPGTWTSAPRFAIYIGPCMDGEYHLGLFITKNSDGNLGTPATKTGVGKTLRRLGIDATDIRPLDAKEGIAVYVNSMYASRDIPDGLKQLMRNESRYGSRRKERYAEIVDKAVKSFDSKPTFIAFWQKIKELDSRVPKAVAERAHKAAQFGTHSSDEGRQPKEKIDVESKVFFAGSPCSDDVQEE